MLYIRLLAAAMSLAAPLSFAAVTQAEASWDRSAWEQQVAAERDINELGRLYLELTLEQSPHNSVFRGLHGTAAEPTRYDDRMADASPVARASFDSARETLLAKLEGIGASALSRSDQIDLHILKKRVELHLFNSRELGSGASPFTWSSALSTGLSSLLMRDFAPLDQRLSSLGKRCAATGDYLGGVKASLAPDDVLPTEQHKKTALAQLGGLDRDGGLFDKTIPDLLASSSLSDDQQRQILEDCSDAREQIKAFTAWYQATVMPREASEWRTGKAIYDRQFDLQNDYYLTPDELLARAEQALEDNNRELEALARRIHDAYLVEEIEAGTYAPAAEQSDQAVVRNVFAKLSEDRPTPDSLVEDSYALADGIIAFVKDNDLMDLPPATKLRIEPVPPQLSGNSVAFIQTAPAFEPHLESVWFWDIELLRSAPDYLKEYNRTMLAIVYIHEGVPGHFVQLEYSNRAERLIPKVFFNGPMVEGWASYITTQLVAEGYTVYPNHPLGHELQQMTDIKMVLRALTNAIIDLKLNRTDWPEEEALALMIERGYQQPGEAQGKLGRAKMGAVQLSSYYAGFLAIEDILAEYRAKKGDAFSYKEFNERLVGAGSPPFFAIREFMLEDE
ncbi:hypothetical protein BST95_16695 [Halioglobus japonicus]|uniref:DUF885 domain-containing protein n=1 Tax=Halioglobus japonicus TaxID=930805 RepID=A0AAP8SP86_9GAMM|nr:DUF885 domain-containing protein [Halioglobus japonicus]AQA19629.1 hypothetical protein BST95_16695 [Halioglobus japonicus]PLW87301.1 DUF885 domain-containing protein [Halioglobus japonicus]GHD09123.1 hypothetical protein GCM10007052_06960 [Halioglobus japonicus]